MMRSDDFEEFLYYFFLDLKAKEDDDLRNPSLHHISLA